MSLNHPSAGSHHHIGERTGVTSIAEEEEDVFQIEENSETSRLKTSLKSPIEVTQGLGESRGHSKERDRAEGRSESSAGSGGTPRANSQPPILPSRPRHLKAVPSSPKESILRPSPSTTSNLASNSRFAPLEWAEFFEKSEDVHIPNSRDKFHVYTSGSTGPVVFCLHGGGYSGLSFALAAKKMRSKDSNIRIVAMDLRGHGLSSTSNDSDLSSQTLCADVAAVVEQMYGDKAPGIVLVGHSMGGAIAVRVAALGLIPTICGLIVIDVVEGTAMASLVHMHSILSNRPPHFPSLEKAVEWSVRAGHLRNLDSARISIPATVVLDESNHRYEWRTRLEESEPHWKGWYEGLSDAFLAAHVPKLLLLAGTDRLDRPLTIAQMQGRFQMLVVRHSGHAIQEDEPEEFASTVVHFVHRNRIGERGVEIPRWPGR